MSHRLYSSVRTLNLLSDLSLTHTRLFLPQRGSCSIAAIYICKRTM